MLKFLHAADFHLDSAFGALRPAQAAVRRRESRETLRRLANYANSHGADLVLLSGDLLDSGETYQDTVEALQTALGSIAAPVFIAPGNHDWYAPGSPYAAENWPENVHIFRTGAIACVDVPACGAAVYGAAFTAPFQDESLLRGFSAPADGKIHFMALHADLDVPASRYNPVSGAEAADSGLAYLALGHVHQRSAPKRFGSTMAAYPGCMEGRGFDELGEKGFYEGTVEDDGTVALTFVPFARHRYEILSVDVTGRDVRAAVEAVLPPDTLGDLYRIRLIGETDEAGAAAPALQMALSDRFYALDVRDETRPAEELWKRAGEDSLRGLFLRELREKLDSAQTEEERSAVCQAVRFGLAALDNRDLN